MKKLTLSLAIMAIGFCATAQKSEQPLKFSVGVEAGLPLGDFKTVNSFGIGGSVQGEYAAAEKIGITLSAGFLSFGGKTVDLGEGLPSYKGPSTSDVPVLAGAKIYLTENVFVHPQVGLSFFNNGLGSAFTYVPAIGVKASENFDVSIKYQGASKNGGTLSFLGLRAAYNF